VTIRITILNGPLKDTQVNLDGEVLIGRSQECHLQLREKTVSRQHARIVPGEGAVMEKISSTGVLKCDGKEVERLVLKHRQRVQCGAILLLVEDLSQSSSAQLVPSRSKAPLREESELPVKLDQRIQGDGFDQEQTQALGYPEEKPESDRAPKLDAARSFSPKRLLQAGGLVVLLLVAWRVFSNIEAPAVPQLVLPYKAGEEKLIDLSGYFKRFGIEEDPADLSIDRGDLVRAQLELFSILRIKTLEQGDAIITLKDQRNQPMLDLKINLRGVVEPSSKILELEMLSEAQKLERARALMNQGGLLKQDNAYQAYLQYKEAMEILESVSTTHPLYLRCRDEMKAPKQAFDDRLEHLWDEVTRHRKNKSYDRALILVDEILSMVGDGSQLDYQRAQIYRKHLMIRIPK